MNEFREERVFWQENFYGDTFDFRSQLLLWRFDRCLFVDCTFLIDASTEQLAFTGCTFKDCNIDHIDSDIVRGLTTRDDYFDRPLRERKADFDQPLTAALSDRKRI